MDILQNRPESYRLNFADFGEVYRGPCVKGVITEFKQIQDDPITVQPLVKVDLGGDFIPLFYHPKPSFWDDDQHQATDFNEDGKYFEKAWMSFRPGDEVAVMLQKGTPVAVLGFSDGLPRLGEALFQIAMNSMLDDFGFLSGAPYVADFKAFPISNSGPTLYPSGIGDFYIPSESGSWSPYNWNLNEKGPDDKNLQLVKKCSVTLLRTSVEETDSYYFCNAWVFEPAPDPPRTQKWLDIWWKQHNETTTTEYAVMLSIGPFIFRVKFAIQITRLWDTLWAYLDSSPAGIFFDKWHDYSHIIYDPVLKTRSYEDITTYQDPPPPGTGQEIPWADVMQSWAISQIPEFNPATDGMVKLWFLSADPDGYTITTPSDSFPGQQPAPGPDGQENGEPIYAVLPTQDLASNYMPFTVGAAPYKKELEDDFESDEFIYQSDFSIMMMINLTNLGVPDPDNMAFYVRPHTKEELQAAGMWPVAAGA